MFTVDEKVGIQRQNGVSIIDLRHQHNAGVGE